MMFLCGRYPLAVHPEGAVEGPITHAAAGRALQEDGAVLPGGDREIGVEPGAEFLGGDADDRRHGVGSVKGRIGAQHNLNALHLVDADRDDVVEG
jgi:hypothetical protein